MSSKPFNVVATAVTKSPNMESYISESLRLSRILGNRMLLVYTSKKNEQAEEYLYGMIKNFDASANVEIIWKEGDPATAILKVAAEQEVNLILTATKTREGLQRYYKGSVPRRLVRSADCSILLLTGQEKSKASTYQRIVANGLDHPKTAHTLKTAVDVAKNFKAAELIIVEEVEPTRVGIELEEGAKSQGDIISESITYEGKERIDNILSEIKEKLDFKIDRKSLFGKMGYAIGHFAETSSADLLIMNSPDTKLGFLDRVFTHDLEYVLSELPCDLLIVHSSRRSN